MIPFLKKAVTISLVLGSLFSNPVFINPVFASGGMEESSGNLMVTDEGWKILSDSTASAETIDISPEDIQDSPPPSSPVEGFKNKLLATFLILAAILGGGIYLFRRKRT